MSQEDFETAAQNLVRPFLPKVVKVTPEPTKVEPAPPALMDQAAEALKELHEKWDGSRAVGRAEVATQKLEGARPAGYIVDEAYNSEFYKGEPQPEIVEFFKENKPHRVEHVVKPWGDPIGQKLDGQPTLNIPGALHDEAVLEAAGVKIDPLTSPIEEVVHDYQKVKQILDETNRQVEDGFDDLKPGAEKLPSKGPVPHVNYQKRAIRAAFRYAKDHLEVTDTHVEIFEDDFFVVWFAKVLQNYKALVSSSLPDGMYYEVTYNGDKAETYVDAYKKFKNVCYKD